MSVRNTQQTHTQHPVPQNIMDVEFKLIGDLTMRQFIYLVVFGVAGYISSISLVGFFKWPFTLFFILLGLALAFVPIQERGMDEWIVNFIKAMYDPTRLIWKQEASLPSAFAYQNMNVVRQELITLAPTSSRRKLEQYLETQKVAPRDDELDIPEEEYLMKVKAAFAEVEVKSPLVAHHNELPAPVMPSAISTAVVEEPKSQQTPDTKATPSSLPQPVVATPVPAPKPKPVIVQRPQPKKAIVRTYPRTEFGGVEQHVGRRFTNLLPSEGQLILPVRGETILKTSEELNIEEDINTRTAQLHKLLDQIKGDEEFKGIIAAGPSAVTTDTSKQKIHEAEAVVNKVKEENERLSNEIKKLKDDVQSSQESVEQKHKKEKIIKKLEEEKTSANQDYTALQKQILELQKRLKEQSEAAQPNTGSQRKEAEFSKMKPITSEPNVVSGILKTPEGKPIEGSVLLIKNHKGEAVRAVKTNSLGQFSISTPLVNGMYTIEVGTSAEKLTFDIISLDVKGDVIPPIEIMGRKN